MTTFQKPMATAIIAKYLPKHFGIDEKSSKNICSHWLIMDIVTRTDFFDNIDEIYEQLHFYKNNYDGPKDHVKLALVELDTLIPGKEAVGYDNTHYISIIQRLWKKKYAEKQKQLKLYNE